MPTKQFNYLLQAATNCCHLSEPYHVNTTNITTTPLFQQPLPTSASSPRFPHLPPPVQQKTFTNQTPFQTRHVTNSAKAPNEHHATYDVLWNLAKKTLLMALGLLSTVLEFTSQSNLTSIQNHNIALQFLQPLITSSEAATMLLISNNTIPTYFTH